MTIRIKNITEIRRRFDHILESLQDGPVFIAKDKRVRAVLMDMSDYYSLMEELEDLNELLQDVGNCCEEDSMVTRLTELGLENEGD